MIKFKKNLRVVLFTTYFILNAIINSTAQIPSFAWIAGSGSDTINQPRTFGDLGVFSINNTPGARGGNSMSWTDMEGNLWLFGGGSYNDLLKFDIKINKWTWINGSNKQFQNGVYGIRGIASTSNMPGSRNDGLTWTDTNGNFWLFGGYSNWYTSSDQSQIKSGTLNDLWRYDVKTNQWTWIGGSSSDEVNQHGVYGYKGSPWNINIPGSRSMSISWTDKKGNLWLFGGVGLDKNNKSGALNDLWRYDIKNNEWTWISGSDTVTSVGIYGIKGKASDSTVPSPRYQSISWVDTSGNFWLFGGFTGTGIVEKAGYLNDLWKYDPNKNQWTWMSGSNIGGQVGVYGYKNGKSSSANTPGCRRGAVSWVDSNNNLILFGGYGLAGSYFGDFNDLWRYNIDKNIWTWMAGSNLPIEKGSYGTKGISSLYNIPGGRHYSRGWYSLGKLYLFGGEFDYNLVKRYDDLWQIDLLPNDVCSKILKPTFNESNFAFCTGDSITISLKQYSLGDEIKWYYGNKIDTLNATKKVFNDSIKFYVIKVDTLGCLISSDTIQLKKYPIPSPPIITRDNQNNLVSNTSSVIWYRDNIKLGDTTQSIKPIINGVYNAITKQNGCPSQLSQGYYYLTNSINNLAIGDFFKTSPNPTSDELLLDYKLGNETGITIRIVDNVGKTVLLEKNIHSGQKINISKLGKGIYILHVSGMSGKFLTHSQVIKK